jgi:caffeoyl-CoA O-methyltransferase
MDKKLDNYIHDFSSPEDAILSDLYRQTHIKFVNPNMVSGHLQGKLLEFISWMVKPERIIEIGTFTGYSAISLARGLKPEGKLFTVEMNDEMKDFSNSYFIKAGLEEKIVQLTGDARKIIPGLDEKFDLAFIDGDKREYIEYYNIIIRKMRPKGFILADNVLWGGQVLDKNTKDPQARGIIEFNEMIRQQRDIEEVILPMRDGLMLIRVL